MIKICIRENDDNHYEQYIRYKDNQGYIYQGWFLSYESAMRHLHSTIPYFNSLFSDIEFEIKHHNSNEEIYLRGEKLLFETWLIGPKETECSSRTLVELAHDFARQSVQC